MVDPGSTRPAASRKRGTLEERFWAKVRRGAPGECWEWLGARNDRGYGTISEGGRRRGHVKAHRAAWTLSNGPIPGGLCVCHRCDNPPCVNPSHLFLGTMRDNTRDMMSKGRMSAPPHRFGAAHHNVKLTPADAERIIADPRPAVSVAAEYGVSPALIWRIRSGRNWVAATGVRAARRPRGKLTRELALQIRADPRPMRMLMAAYGVGHHVIQQVLQGKHWSIRDDADASTPLRRGVPTGQYHPGVKIDRETALRIREASGSCGAVGGRFGVSPMVVSVIRRGLHWSVRECA